jgi:AhpD family alkylhydroperoxidase
MTDTNYTEKLERLQQGMGMLGGALPATMGSFGQLHASATADGALSGKVKELLALGIAIAVRCEGCITYHAEAARAAGACREEIVETIGVAVLMGGGPSVVYGTEALRAFDQFAELAR